MNHIIRDIEENILKEISKLTTNEIYFQENPLTTNTKELESLSDRHIELLKYHLLLMSVEKIERGEDTKDIDDILKKCSTEEMFGDYMAAKNVVKAVVAEQFS